MNTKFTFNAVVVIRIFRLILPVGIIVAALCFLGFPAEAQDSDSVPNNSGIAAAYYNGYNIDNQTSERLTLSSVYQPGGTVCDGFGCTAFAEGFGDEPPQTIEPHAQVYFDIPVYVAHGETYDETYVTYATERGAPLEFVADVHFGWGWLFFPGIPNFAEDLSACSVRSVPGLSCDLTKSEGRGTQTTFLLTEPDEQ